MVDGGSSLSLAELGPSGGRGQRPSLPPDLLQRIVALENMFDPSYETRLGAVEDNLRQINVRSLFH